MDDKRFSRWVVAVCMLLLFLAILFIAIFPNFAFAIQTVNLQYGQCVTIKNRKYCAPAKNVCPVCPAPQICPTPKPCPSCPPPVVCPTPAPVPVPTIEPTPIPIPTPAPTQSPTPVGKTIDQMCSMYVNSNRDNASAADLDRANKMRGYCEIVFTWWQNLPSQTWCPYIMQNSSVKFCGPYDNIGYIWKSDPVYNNYIVPNKPSWILKNASGTPVGDMWDSGKTKTVVNIGFPEARQWFIDCFKSPPPGAQWTGTFKDRAWSARWLDDFGLRPINNNVWDMAPIDSKTGLTLTNDVWQGYKLDELRTLRTDADANGYVLVANILSDVFWTDVSKYPYNEALNYVDYAVFEILVSNLDGSPQPENEWLRRVKNFQWIAKNSKAIPVGTTEYGNFDYNLATVLLACEPGRCMTWQQPLMTDAQIQKVESLDLGTPLGDFGKANCYIRAWTKGTVAANPMDTPCSVPWNGSTVTVQPKQGVILTK